MYCMAEGEYHFLVCEFIHKSTGLSGDGAPIGGRESGGRGGEWLLSAIVGSMVTAL